MPFFRSLWWVHPALLLVALMHGAGYKVSKAVMPTPLEPAVFVLIRLAAGSLIFLLLHQLFVKQRIATRKDYLQLFVCGFFGASLKMLLLFYGLNATSPINASVIMISVPIMVLLFSYLWRREPITRHRWLGIALGALGSLLLLSNLGEATLSQASFFGDGLVLLNTCSYAVYLVLVKRLMTKYHPFTVMKWVFLFGTLGTLLMRFPVFFRTPSPILWGEITTNEGLCILYAVLFTTVGTYLLNASAMRHVSPTVVGYYVYLQPIFATLIELALGQEIPSFLKILAAIFIFSGVFMVNYPGQKKLAAPSPAGERKG